MTATTTAIKVFIAITIGVIYSFILLITFLIATQAVADIIDWMRTEMGAP